MLKYVVTQFMRTVVGASRQWAPCGEMYAWWRASLIHPLHVYIVESDNHTERFAKIVNGYWAVLIEVG